MPDITATTLPAASEVKNYLWEQVNNDDTPLSVELPGTVPILSAIQFVGTFGGATAVLQGSNDNVNWVGLSDITGITISLTGVGGSEFSTAFRYLRPSFSGGGGTQDIDVYLTARG